MLAITWFSMLLLSFVIAAMIIILELSFWLIIFWFKRAGCRMFLQLLSPNESKTYCMVESHRRYKFVQMKAAAQRSAHLCQFLARSCYGDGYPAVSICPSESFSWRVFLSADPVLKERATATSCSPACFL